MVTAAAAAGAAATTAAAATTTSTTPTAFFVPHLRRNDVDLWMFSKTFRFARVHQVS